MIDICRTAVIPRTPPFGKMLFVDCRCRHSFWCVIVLPSRLGPMDSLVTVCDTMDAYSVECAKLSTPIQSDTGRTVVIPVLSVVISVISSIHDSNLSQTYLLYLIQYQLSAHPHTLRSSHTPSLIFDPCCLMCLVLLVSGSGFWFCASLLESLICPDLM